MGNRRFVRWSLDEEHDDILYLFYWEMRFYKSLPRHARKALREQVDDYWSHCGGFDWIDVLEWIQDNCMCSPYGKNGRN